MSPKKVDYSARNALVVLSGGQDSTTALFWARYKFARVHALTFNYGQRHSREIAAARAVGAMTNVVSHETLDVPDVLAGTSFLTDKARDVQTFENFETMSHYNAFKENKLDSSFVPMRNSLFLTLAANRAVVNNCSAIITGITAADFAEYGEFSWEWFGGFVDAEGTFSQVNGNSWRLSVSQKDPELLHRLKKWLREQIPKTTASVSVDKRDCAELYIGARSAAPIMKLLSPHLHSPHRRAQATKKGVELSPEADLTDAYVTGFWEGDGSCYSHLTRNAKNGGKYTLTASFDFGFYQKDPEVLDKIKSYLGEGYMYQAQNQNQIWALRVSDDPVEHKLLRRLRPHMCVLGSFEKISKWRHRIGMDAGGFNPPYPDCTPDFVWRQEIVINEALRSPFQEPIEIITPVMFLTKAQSIWLARTLPGCMEALAYSHTAYSGEYPPVTQDHATVLRAQGFLEADTPDPLIVRAHREGLCALPDTTNYDAVRAESAPG